MIRLYARHEVANFASWKQAYDAFDAERQTYGVADHAVYQAADNPNDVTVWHDFASEHDAQEFAQSNRLHEVMQNAGVIGQPLIWLTSEA